MQDPLSKVQFQMFIETTTTFFPTNSITTTQVGPKACDFREAARFSIQVEYLGKNKGQINFADGLRNKHHIYLNITLSDI